MEQIIEVVCRRFKVSRERLYTPGRGRNNEARDIAIYLIGKHTGLRLNDIAKPFNMTNYSSVGSVVLRTKKQLQHDNILGRNLEKTEIELTINKMRQAKT